MAAQSSHVRLCPRRPSLRLRAALVAGSCVLLLAPSEEPQQAPVREYPPGEYYLPLNIYQAGEFTDAARAFRSAARSGVRSSEGRWVDSICYHTMLGESMYQMGELSQAADEYTAALNLFLVHRNWMLRVDFPDVLQPDQGKRTSSANMGSFYPSFGASSVS